MNDTDFQKRVMTLCDRALEFEQEQRQSYLDEACKGDAALRDAVDKLISTVDQTSDFLQPVSQDSEIAPGDMIGDYRVVSTLGSGGMGSVYLAERVAEDYSQQVAIKIMRTFLQSKEMIRRFDEERRILARLHHPYIARLIDGGTTQAGLPFLVTELIEGVSIDRYCDTHKLNVNQRLGLVQKVALALQSAHQNLVVHGDLKPGNILVTDDGIPKLLDFGVARLERPVDDEERDAATNADLVALTPDYASPEQIGGEVMTTISDVYSLGVLTYSLVVGETPYEIKAGSRAQLVERLGHTLVRPPSEHVLSPRKPALSDIVARNRKTTTAKLARKLRGDLDAVLQKSLRRNPHERYPSALIFANELKHVVRRLPVLAQGDSTSYRLGKFVSRNRVSVVAGSAALVALMTGMGISLWQAHIAERRFSDLHGFAETVIFEMHDEIADLPGGTAARQLMTRESLHYLDRLAKDAGGDRKLQLDLSKAYKRLGDVLGNPTNSNMGDVASAVNSYNKALVITDELLTSGRSDPAVQRHKAILHEKLGDVLAWTGDLDGAIEQTEYAMQMFKELALQHPENKIALLSVAISTVKRGDVLGHPSFPNAGRTEEALQSYREGLELIMPLVGREDSPERTDRYHALLHERIGTMLALDERIDEAVVHYETSLESRRKQAAKDPGNANTRRDIGVALEKIGDIRLAGGDAMASLPYYRDSLVIYRSQAESDPENAHAARTLAIGLENLADALIAADKSTEARVHFDEVMIIREQLATNNPENERYVSEFENFKERYNAL